MNKKRPSLTDVLGKGQGAGEESAPQDSANPHVRQEDSVSKSELLRQGKYKQLKALIPSDLHKRIKLLSVETDRDISDLVEEALRAHFDDT